MQRHPLVVWEFHCKQERRRSPTFSQNLTKEKEMTKRPGMQIQGTLMLYLYYSAFLVSSHIFKMFLKMIVLLGSSL